MAYGSLHYGAHLLETASMRILGSIVVGMVTLLGSSAHADPPVLGGPQAVWQGCTYSIRSQAYTEPSTDPRDPYGTVTRYKIVVQRESSPSSTCLLAPTIEELATSEYEPQVAIAANSAGLVAAYSWATYVRFVGAWGRVSIHSLNPSPVDPLRLDTTRKSTVLGSFHAAPGEAGFPGTTSLGELILYPDHLQVHGPLSGNWLSAEPGPNTPPSALLQGNHFVAVYPDFFGTAQQAPILDAYTQ
ncbi:hypothetical protein BON30_22150 [Cystobacter ferrugineus]|uniref:Uncharacterized protein n=1 Tax=Cystobacter ferrugineus TaxID=83449 RepID=A0A1L9B9K6_9BACT|nr:hypothetical protein BON30_22150 [Cystobacter ferrugineus]